MTETLYDPKEIERAMRPTEHNHQATFFDMLHLKYLNAYPEIHPLFFAVPNGIALPGKKRDPRRFAIINKMKREGMTPGVADTLFLSGRGGYFGLGLEFKRPERVNEKNGGLDDNQLEFMNGLRMEGYKPAVAYGADHAESIVEKYLAMPKTQDLIYRALRCLEEDKPNEAREILQDVVRVW